MRPGAAVCVLLLGTAVAAWAARVGPHAAGGVVGGAGEAAARGAYPGDGEDEHSAAWRFLEKWRPARDADLSEDYIHSHIELALKARHRTPWAAAVPFEEFLNYVLPYAIVDEPR